MDLHDVDLKRSTLTWTSMGLGSGGSLGVLGHVTVVRAGQSTDCLPAESSWQAGSLKQSGSQGGSGLHGGSPAGGAQGYPQYG